MFARPRLIQATAPATRPIRTSRNSRAKRNTIAPVPEKNPSKALPSERSVATGRPEVVDFAFVAPGVAPLAARPLDASLPVVVAEPVPVPLASVVVAPPVAAEPPDAPEPVLWDVPDPDPPDPFVELPPFDPLPPGVVLADALGGGDDGVQNNVAVVDPAGSGGFGLTDWFTQACTPPAEVSASAG